MKEKHDGRNGAGYGSTDHILSLESGICVGCYTIDQFLHIDVEGFSQFLQHIRVGLSSSGFPTADGLARYIELPGQVFLFQVIPNAQAFEVLIK